MVEQVVAVSDDDILATNMSILVHQLNAFAATVLAKQLYSIELRFPKGGVLRDRISQDAVYESILRWAVGGRCQ